MAGDSDLMTAGRLPTPLPRDFTLSYELVAAQNFTWGAKGLTLQLTDEKSAGNAQSYVRLRLRPGFDGRDGEAVFETKFPAGYMTGTKWMAATGFSNDKKHNRIAVSVRKTGERLQVFIDSNLIVDEPKALPADLQFNALSFVSGGNYGENDRFYVSNIKINK